jgi:hypothetical protein
MARVRQDPEVQARLARFLGARIQGFTLFEVMPRIRQVLDFGKALSPAMVVLLLEFERDLVATAPSRPRVTESAYAMTVVAPLASRVAGDPRLSIELVRFMARKVPDVSPMSFLPRLANTAKGRRPPSAFVAAILLGFRQALDR